MVTSGISQWIEVVGILLKNVKQLLAIHLIYVILGIIIFTPLAGIIGRGLLMLSGQSALSDFDILYFFLSPMGMVSALFFAALLISILVFEQASIMAVCADHTAGRHVGVMQALTVTFVRIKPIFLYGVQLVARLLILILPFLAVCAAIAWLLFSDYDINYYLSEKPPVFWGGAISMGLVLMVLAVLLVRKLLDWSMTLPLLLFSGVPAGQSFSKSQTLVKHRRSQLLVLFGIWIAAVIVLNIVLLSGIQVMGSQLVPLFSDSIGLLAFVLGGLAALYFLGNFFLTSLFAGSFGILLLTLAAEYDLSYEFGVPKKDVQGWLAGLTAPRLAYVLVGAIVVSGFLGLNLLQGIDVQHSVSIIAHRGAAGRAPENTIAAVRAAVEDGADWVEIDVQESLDGEIVVVHDSDLMKLAGVNRKIWDMSLAELQQVDVGSWFADEFSAERIPTLGEVLEEVRGKSLLLIELKYYGHDQKLEQRVAEVVEQAGMTEDVAFMSLNRGGIEKLQNLRPDWKTGLLLSKTIGDLSSLALDFLAVNMGTTGPGFIRRAHGGGKKLFVWTVNDQISMARLMSLGVDGVITDEPAMARSVAAELHELNSIERLLLQAAVLLDHPIPQKNYRDQSP